MSKVSVIIPTYNRADLLPRTINSVLNQTFKDFELFVVDDGSTDNTKEVVENFVNKDKRVKYIWQENSGGAASPKNTAFKYCTGEYIAYLDHDDEWLPTKLEKQLALFEKSDKKLGLVSCNVLIINTEKKSEGIHKMSKYKSAEDLLLRAGDYAFSNSSVMIPYSVIKVVGLRDENLKLFEDQDFFVRIALAGFDFGFVDEVLVKYFIDEANLSKDFKKAAPDYDRFLLKHNSLLSLYPKIFATHNRHLGTMQFLAGETFSARKSFLKSIKLNSSIRNILTFACSLLGRRFYLFLLNFKKTLALN